MVEVAASPVDPTIIVGVIVAYLTTLGLSAREASEAAAGAKVCCLSRTGGADPAKPERRRRSARLTGLRPEERLAADRTRRTAKSPCSGDAAPLKGPYGGEEAACPR